MEGVLSRKRSGLLDLFVNSRSRSLAVPLLIATLFCFGYMFVQQPSRLNPTSTSATKSQEDEQVELPDIPLSEQTHLPTLEADGTVQTAQSPATASPQTGAVPNNNAGRTNNNSDNQNQNEQSGSNKKKSLTSEVKSLVPLLP